MNYGIVLVKRGKVVFHFTTGFPFRIVYRVSRSVRIMVERLYTVFSRLSASALINFTETQTRRLIETRRLLSSTSVNDYNDNIYWTYTIRGPLILITEFCHPCATYYRYYPLATYSAQLRPFFV